MRRPPVSQPTDPPDCRWVSLWCAARPEPGLDLRTAQCSCRPVGSRRYSARTALSFWQPSSQPYDCQCSPALCTPSQVGRFQAFPDALSFTATRVLTRQQLDGIWPPLLFSFPGFNGSGRATVPISFASSILYLANSSSGQPIYLNTMQDSGDDGQAILGNTWTEHILLQVGGAPVEEHAVPAHPAAPAAGAHPARARSALLVGMADRGRGVGCVAVVDRLCVCCCSILLFLTGCLLMPTLSRRLGVPQSSARSSPTWLGCAPPEHAQSLFASQGLVMQLRAHA